MSAPRISVTTARARFASDSGATDEQMREAAEVLRDHAPNAETRRQAENWLTRAQDEAPR